MSAGVGAGDEQWVADPRFELRELRRPDFPVLRKGGLDPESVDAYLGRIERLGDQFLKFTRELEARIAHAKAEATDARRSEHKAVDAAMLAAIEAKHRILTEAGERAWEIEEEARKRAAELLAAGPAAAPAASEAGERELLERIDALEHEVQVWRSKASRLEQDAQRNAGFVTRTDGSPTPRQDAVEANPLASEILATAETAAADLLAAARTEAADTKESAASILGRAQSQASGIVTAARAEAARILEVAASERDIAAEARTAAEAESRRINERAGGLAAERADEVLGEAKSEALAILDAAERRREILLAEATDSAQAEAARILESARTEAELMITSAGETIREARLAVPTEAAVAQAEAQHIVAEARRRAAGIVAEAEAIMADARRRISEAERSEAQISEAQTLEKSGMAEAELAAQRIVDDARQEAARIVADADAAAAEGHRVLEEAHASRASTANILAQAKDAVRRSIVEARQTVIDAHEEAGRILEAARTEAAQAAGQPVDG